MEKKERINQAFSYLKDNGLVHTQKDLAERMGSTAPNVSSALKGVDNVLTDNFLLRFNNAFGGIFNDNWLLTGEGSMLSASEPDSISASSSTDISAVLNKAMDEIAAQRRLTEKSQQQIDRLLSLLEADRHTSTASSADTAADSPVQALPVPAARLQLLSALQDTAGLQPCHQHWPQGYWQGHRCPNTHLLSGSSHIRHAFTQSHALLKVRCR